MSYKLSRRRFIKLSAAAAMAAAAFSLTGCDSSSSTPTAPDIPPFGKTQTIAGGIVVNFKETQFYQNWSKYQAFVDVTIPADYLKPSESIYIKPSDFSAKLDGKDIPSNQLEVHFGPGPNWSKLSDTGLRTYSNTTQNFRIQLAGPVGASKLQVSYTFKYGDVEETATAEGDVSANQSKR